MEAQLTYVQGKPQPSMTDITGISPTLEGLETRYARVEAELRSFNDRFYASGVCNNPSSLFSESDSKRQYASQRPITRLAGVAKILPQSIHLLPVTTPSTDPPSSKSSTSNEVYSPINSLIPSDYCMTARDYGDVVFTLRIRFQRVVDLDERRRISEHSTSPIRQQDLGRNATDKARVPQKNTTASPQKARKRKATSPARPAKNSKLKKEASKPTVATTDKKGELEGKRYACPYYVGNPVAYHDCECYSSRGQLNDHLRDQHFKIWQCDGCGYRCAKESNLNRHKGLPQIGRSSSSRTRSSFTAESSSTTESSSGTTTMPCQSKGKQKADDSGDTIAERKLADYIKKRSTSWEDIFIAIHNPKSVSLPNPVRPPSEESNIVRPPSKESKYCQIPTCSLCGRESFTSSANTHPHHNSEEVSSNTNMANQRPPNSNAQHISKEPSGGIHSGPSTAEQERRLTGLFSAHSTTNEPLVPLLAEGPTRLVEGPEWKKRLEQWEQRLEQREKRLEQQEQRLDQIFEQREERFQQREQAFEQREQRLGRQETNLLNKEGELVKKTELEQETKAVEHGEDHVNQQHELMPSYPLSTQQDIPEIDIPFSDAQTLTGETDDDFRAFCNLYQSHSTDAQIQERSCQ